MKLTETGDIEVKTFSVDNTKEFSRLNLSEKLEMLSSLVDGRKEEYSSTNEAAEMSCVFEKAMNEMYNGKGNVALIVERKILILDKSVQRRAIEDSGY